MTIFDRLLGKSNKIESASDHNIKHIYKNEEYGFTVECPKNWVEIHVKDLPTSAISDLDLAINFAKAQMPQHPVLLELGNVHDFIQKSFLVGFVDPQSAKNNICISVHRVSTKMTTAETLNDLMIFARAMGEILSTNIIKVDDIDAVEVTCIVKLYKVITKLVCFYKGCYGYTVICTALADKFKLYDLIFDECIKSIKFEHRPDDADSHYILGASYHEKELYKEAEDEYLQALRLDPQHYMAYCNLGSIFMKTGRCEQGIEYFKKALEIHPDDPLLLFNIGKFYLSDGDIDGSFENFCKAIVLDMTYESKIHQFIYSHCHPPNQYVQRLDRLVNERLRKIYLQNNDKRD